MRISTALLTTLSIKVWVPPERFTARGFEIGKEDFTKYTKNKKSKKIKTQEQEEEG